MLGFAEMALAAEKDDAMGGGDLHRRLTSASTRERTTVGG
jgi:hypothetical protein